MENNKTIEMSLCLNCYWEMQESHNIHISPDQPKQPMAKRTKCARCGDQRFCQTYDLGGALNAE